jgi:hypothetical protein
LVRSGVSFLVGPIFRAFLPVIGPQVVLVP